MKTECDYRGDESPVKPEDMEARFMIGKDDIIVCYEYERSFIRFHFADRRILKFTSSDVGKDMLERLKAQAEHSRSLVSLLRTTKRLSNIIPCCWERVTM